jgi:hypothetical protein
LGKSANLLFMLQISHKLNLYCLEGAGARLLFRFPKLYFAANI